MEFRKVLALRGPSVWASFPVLEAWVDLGELDKPSNEFPGFNDRLMAWMPTMIEHRCSIGHRGGFFQRLRNGTYLGHVLDHGAELAGQRREALLALGGLLVGELGQAHTVLGRHRPEHGAAIEMVETEPGRDSPGDGAGP